MKIKTWKWKNREQPPIYVVRNPCPCGCSRLPYVYICDGQRGARLEFQNFEELKTFKKQVKKLEFPTS